MSNQIASRDELSLHVYRARTRQDHGPRVHLRRPNDEATSVLSLPLLELLIGPQPNPSETEFLLQHLQDAIDAWEELNDNE